jgi:hypothetical protein
VQCLKAAFGHARPDHAVSAHGLAEALEPALAQILHLEQTADQTPRAVGDHHLSGRGQALQPGGEVRRPADDGALACLVRADEVAHHDQPGCDPDARRQSFGRRDPKPLDRRHDRKPSVHGALRRVLVGCGPAEIAEDAVAHELGDVAAEAGDRTRHCVLVRPG